MHKMKKSLTILIAAGALLLAGAPAFAQMHVGAGYLNSTDFYKLSENADATTTAYNGFYAGFGYTVPVAGGLRFTPGIYYSFRTANDASNVGELAGFKGSTTEHNVNVPITLSYGFSPNDNVRFFVYGGPTASIGIASTTKLSASILGYKAEESVNNYDDNGYGRFNVFLGAGIGAEIGECFRITCGYDWGMLNRYTGNTSGISQRTNQLTAGISYLF